MFGQRIARIRVSSFDQPAERQLDGIALDRVFTDTASGRDAQRSQLTALMTFIRERDTLFVHSMDRLAREFDALRRRVRELAGRGVQVHCVKKGLTFPATPPLAHLLLSVREAFVAFERTLIRAPACRHCPGQAARGLQRPQKSPFSRAGPQTAPPVRPKQPWRAPSPSVAKRSTDIERWRQAETKRRAGNPGKSEKFAS